jgi:hypothetical protein
MHGSFPPITTSGFQGIAVIMQFLLLSNGAVWMRTVTYFIKRSSASFFMDGKKAE